MVAIAARQLPLYDPRGEQDRSDLQETIAPTVNKVRVNKSLSDRFIEQRQIASALFLKCRSG